MGKSTPLAVDEIAVTLRNAGFTGATCQRLSGRVKTSGFRVNESPALMPGTVAMVCQVHPAKQTEASALALVAAEPAILQRYVGALAKAGWTVAIMAGCVWVTCPPAAAAGTRAGDRR